MGQRNVTLLKKEVKSEFDSYKMTIRKASSVSLDSFHKYYVIVQSLTVKPDVPKLHLLHCV